jgi:type IV pilus assembly protein PilO
VLKSPTSRWIAGAAGACAVLLASTWFVLVGPKRAEAADLRDQAASARQANDAMQIRTAQLKSQFASLPQRQAELATLIEQMPPTADVPRFVRSLDALAASAGVRLDGVSPGAGESLDAKAGAAGTSGPVAAPAAGGSTSLAVVAVPMTITVHGPYFKTVTFLKGLQSGQRAFLVMGVQVTVDETGVSLGIRGQVFAVPGVAGALAGTTGAAATAGTPAGTATPGAAGQSPAATPASPFGTGQSPVVTPTPTTTPGIGPAPAATPTTTPAGQAPTATPVPTPSPSR